MATSTPFTLNLHGHILQDYAREGTRIGSLYDLAKNKVWNSNAAPWEATVDKRLPPSRPQFEPLSGFPAYDALPPAAKVETSWYRHGLEISDILHGEQGALLVASQLISCMSGVEAKLFASSQVSDEARHVEFFSRYLLEVVGEVYAPSQAVAEMVTTMTHDPRWDFKFIACHVLIESLALARLQEIRHTTLVPVLLYAIDDINADEARHVRFGTEILRNHVAELSAEQVQERSDFIVNNLLRLGNAMNIYTRIAEDQGWDVNALRLHLRRNRIRQPKPRQDRLRQLMLNMKSVGLLTQKTQQRLASLNQTL